MFTINGAIATFLERIGYGRQAGRNINEIFLTWLWREFSRMPEYRALKSRLGENKLKEFKACFFLANNEIRFEKLFLQGSPKIIFNQWAERLGFDISTMGKITLAIQNHIVSCSGRIRVSADIRDEDLLDGIDICLNPNQEYIYI